MSLDKPQSGVRSWPSSVTPSSYNTKLSSPRSSMVRLSFLHIKVYNVFLLFPNLIFMKDSYLLKAVFSLSS